MNLPNSITALRILLAPIFVWLLFVAPEPLSWERWVALVLFVLAISTDGVDGMVARRTDKVTNLGKILDPIADKVLVGGSLLTLSFLGEIQWWITILILVREIGITIYRLIVVKTKVIAASGGGKLKTILQGIAIGVVLAPFEVWFEPWVIFEQVMIYLALISTVVSGIQFILVARKSVGK